MHYALKSYLSFQNVGVKIISTENISRRPISMSSEHAHFAKSGSSFHDMVGPISVPSVGPTLLSVEIVIVTALVLSTPASIMMKAHVRLSSPYTVRNARSVTLRCMDTLTSPKRSGSTALGWSNCRNSFCTIFSSIVQRTHLNPPLVLPAQAPVNMHTARITHVI